MGATEDSNADEQTARQPETPPPGSECVVKSEQFEEISVGHCSRIETLRLHPSSVRTAPPIPANIAKCGKPFYPEGIRGGDLDHGCRVPRSMRPGCPCAPTCSLREALSRRRTDEEGGAVIKQSSKSRKGALVGPPLNQRSNQPQEFLLLWSVASRDEKGSDLNVRDLST